MEIGNYRITSKGVYNIASREKSLQSARNAANAEYKRKARKTSDRIVKQSLTRMTASINRWQSARQTAESVVMPDNTEKIRVYQDIEIDAHLWALMQTIRLKVMANKFSLYTSDDKVDDDATKNFRKKWFRNIIKETVDADFYGFSLVQLGNIVQGCFIEAKIIPRQYVVQQKEGVKKSPANSQDLIYFDDPSFKNWLVPIGDADHLGVLDKAAPLVIKKKEVISAWSEAAEVFGMPIRIGKTNIQDAEAKANMEDMLENMGSAAWGVFDVEDDIELKEASKSDFSNMYDKFIERVNSELSKLVLLQTGTTDEKSFTGAANVHESTLKDVIESYIIKVEDITNEVVIPLCVRHGILPLGAYMKADNEQKVTLKEMFDMVKELLPSYDISEDWISETFDIPIEGKKEVKEPEPVGAKTDKKESLTNIMKAVSKLYPQSNE